MSELRTVTKFVLDDGAPQIDLTVDSVPVVSCSAEVVERFGGVDAAGAIVMWCVVGITLCLAATNDSRSPASRSHGLARMPPLPTERLQPQVFHIQTR